MDKLPEKTIHFQLDGRQMIVALTSAGRLFRQSLDPKNFAQGPNHVPGYLWTEIKGPLDE